MAVGGTGPQRAVRTGEARRPTCPAPGRTRPTPPRCPGTPDGDRDVSLTPRPQTSCTTPRRRTARRASATWHVGNSRRLERPRKQKGRGGRREEEFVRENNRVSYSFYGREGFRGTSRLRTLDHCAGRASVESGTHLNRPLSW